MSIALRDQLIKSMIFFFPVLESNAERVSQVLRDETRQESRQGGKIRARTGSGKNATASVECQREEFVIESLSHSNDSFKTAESFRSESNDCFYEWLSESVIRPRQRRFGFEHRNETKTALLLVSYCRTVRSIFCSHILKFPS